MKELSTTNSTASSPDEIAQLRRELASLQARLNQLETGQAQNEILPLEKARPVALAKSAACGNSEAAQPNQGSPKAVGKGASRRQLLTRMGVAAAGLATLSVGTAAFSPNTAQAENTSNNALVGRGGAQGYGGKFSGGLAQVLLVPATSGTGAPTTGGHQKGELYVDTNGSLYYCNSVDGSGVGVWRRLDSLNAAAPLTYTNDASGGTLSLNITPTNNAGAVALQPTIPSDGGTLQHGKIAIDGNLRVGTLDTNNPYSTIPGINAYSVTNTAVIGQSSSGTGVNGISSSYVGVYAQSHGGAGVVSVSDNNVGLYCISNTSSAATFSSGAVDKPTINALAAPGQYQAIYSAQDSTGAVKASIYPNGAFDGSKYQLNGVTVLENGTAFPASPATNQQFYRTDRNLQYYWDGSRWLTTSLYYLPLVWTPGITTSSTGPGTFSVATPALQKVDNPEIVRDIYVISWSCTTSCNANFDASNSFDLQLYTISPATGPTLQATIYTFQTGRVAGTRYQNQATINTRFPAANAVSFRVDLVVHNNAGTPGPIFPNPGVLTVRYVG